MSCGHDPGLVRQDGVVFRRRRVLPLPGEVLVQVGQRVTPEDIVARAHRVGAVQAVDAAGALGISPADLLAAMEVVVGEVVRQGQLLASTKAFLGLWRNECRAPCAGTVASVSDLTGQIVLEAVASPLLKSAFIQGEIEEIVPDRGAVIAAAGTVVQGVFGIGGEGSGPVVMAVPTADAILIPEMLTAEMCGAVVVGGVLATLPALRAAVEQGVLAVVTGGVGAEDLQIFLGNGLGSGVTGQEQAGLILVVTEGFGAVAMSGHTFDLLGRRQGALASVTGVTQIRAGVVRPEVLIPDEELTVAASESQAVSGLLALSIGGRVRVVGALHFGAVGRVVELPPVPQLVAAEIRARVAVVELRAGERLAIPRANLEPI